MGERVGVRQGREGGCETGERLGVRQERGWV